jgi:hypothetical protein
MIDSRNPVNELARVQQLGVPQAFFASRRVTSSMWSVFFIHLTLPYQYSAISHTEPSGLLMERYTAMAVSGSAQALSAVAIAKSPSQNNDGAL